MEKDGVELVLGKGSACDRRDSVEILFEIKLEP